MSNDNKKHKNYNCHSNHSVFLRANGTIACWCDAGNRYFLQDFDPKINYATDVYLGNIFNNIRDKLKEGLLPFPDFCKKCLSLEVNSYKDDFKKNKKIKTFQVEPSFACNLNCPSCASPEARKLILKEKPSGHLFLNPIVFNKILTDFHNHNIEIETIELQGHGEPLLNEHSWSFIKLAKSLYKSSFLEVITNSNFSFENYMIDSGIDKITFSIDGVDENSYAPYRKNGNFQKAFNFMKDFTEASYKSNKNIYCKWKYVIFDHNDTDQNLLKIQKSALELNINEIHFVLTRLGPGSRRIFKFEQVPILDNNIKITYSFFGIHYWTLHKYYNDIIFDIENKDFKSATEKAHIFSSLMNRLYKQCTTPIPEEMISIINSFEKVAAGLSLL